MKTFSDVHEQIVRLTQLALGRNDFFVMTAQTLDLTWVVGIRGNDLPGGYRNDLPQVTGRGDSPEIAALDLINMLRVRARARREAMLLDVAAIEQEVDDKPKEAE